MLAVSLQAYPNVLGPTVRFQSTRPDGTGARAVTTQLSQTGNGALQSPYIQFGLGETPNFVDSLTVGVPRSQGESR